MVPFDGLHEKQQGQRQHGPVVQTPDGEQHHAHEAEQQQHIPRGKKGGVERGEPRQQQQPPEKAASEVFAAARREAYCRWKVKPKSSAKIA